MSTKEIEFGPRKIVFYPLNLKALRELAPEIEYMTSLTGVDAMKPEAMDRLEKVFLLSAKRGDTSITVEDIREVIDTENMLETVFAIMGQSGFQRATPGGPSLAPTSPRIGGDSTRSLPGTPAGPSAPSTS